MKVCMLAYTFYERDNRVRRYAETLVRHGHQVEAIALCRDGQPCEEVIAGVRLTRIQRRVIDEGGPFSYLLKLLLFFFRSLWVLAVRHLREPYDVVHVHSVPDFEVFAALIPRLFGARIILDVHDIVPEFYASKFKVSNRSIIFRALVLMERLSCAFAHHVIIANDIWYERITGRSVAKEKCTTIINYPDLTIFKQQPHRERCDGQFIVCYPGTLNWHQGLDLAIEAIDLLRDRVPHLRFEIIGDGRMREDLRAMITARGLESRITLSGLVPMEEVARRMTGVDLGIVPKRGDGFGGEAFSTKIMEFMAMGVPVLASRTRIDQLYFNDDLIAFFKDGNVEDLACQIEALAQHPERRNQLRNHALGFIDQNCWSVREPIYLKLIDKLCA